MWQRLLVIKILAVVKAQLHTCLDFKYPFIFGDDSGDTVYTTMVAIGTDLYLGGYSTTSGVRKYS